MLSKRNKEPVLQPRRALILRACMHKLGSWRRDLLWRIVGLSLYEFGILHVAYVNDWKMFSAYGLQ